MLLVAAVTIYYYYQLYLSTKGAKLFLILEVGLRAISFIYYIANQGFTSYLEFIHFIPIFLSISLYIAKGKIATVLFSLLVIFVAGLTINHIVLIFV